MKGDNGTGRYGGIRMRPIGTVFTEHKVASETPIQPAFARGAHGRAVLFPEYEEGLKDLEGFSHIVLLFYFHRAAGARLSVRPFLDDTGRGVFATCAPSRPNGIGISVVRLRKRQGNVLFVEDVDMLDGTPLLDVKPYIRRFAAAGRIRNGWLTSVDEKEARRLGSRGYRRRTERRGRRRRDV